MARKKNAENAETETETQASPEKTAFRMTENSTIHFVDPWSAENSPKKGDATKGRWEVYKEGMTVGQAIEAGLTRSNIRKDRRAGYIRVDTSHDAPAADAQSESESE